MRFIKQLSNTTKGIFFISMGVILLLYALGVLAVSLHIVVLVFAVLLIVAGVYLVRDKVSLLINKNNDRM